MQGFRKCYGGEELAIVLLDTSPPYQLPERLRSAVATGPVPARTGPLHVTISVGVSALAPGHDLETLLARADSAL